MEFEEKVCRDCGAVIENEEYEKVDGEFVCKDCLDEQYIFCEDCQEYHYGNEMREVYMGWRRGTKWVCEDCLNNDFKYFQCNDCEEWFYVPYNSRIDTMDGDVICHECYENKYVTCDGCGAVVEYDDAEHDEDREQYYCSECAQKYKVIHGYSYKPEAVYKTKHDQFWDDTSIEELLMGVELEIDDGCDPYDTAGEICNASPDVYIKHDGSLSDDGMEIVSHPCTLEYHLEDLGWDKICKVARDNGYMSHDTRRCGLHIHVGRYQLGKTEEERDETIAKIILLVDRHKDFMKRFSRRTKSQLSEWAVFPNLNIRNKRNTEEEVIEKALNTRSKGRYQAINITNYRTIEFRLFNGSLKENTVKATLQLVSNICEYAKYASVAEVLRSRWQTICDYSYHRELELYIKERAMLELENPEYIYLGTGKERQEENYNFNVGDIVRVRNADSYGHPALNDGIGEIGRIIHIGTPFGGSNHISVQFVNSFSRDLWTSTTGEENCYNVMPINLEPAFNN